MAQSGPNRWAKSYKVAATVSAYRVVSNDTVTSSDFGYIRVVQIPTETAQILGVSQDYADTTSGQFQPIAVASFGYSKVMAGASVSAGAILTFATATGYAIESAYSGLFDTNNGSLFTSGAKVPKTLGIALQKSTASDAAIECFLSINNIRIRVS